MKRSAASRSAAEQAARRYADDSARWKDRLERRKCVGLGGGSIDRHNDDVVGDIKFIWDAGEDVSKSIAIKADRGNADHFELAAKRVGRFFERRSNRVERIGVGIVRARRCLANDATRRDEAGRYCRRGRRYDRSLDLRRSDHFPGAESLAECLLGSFFGPAIAVWIEQRLPRCQDRAFAVMINRAAFKDEIETAHGGFGEVRNVVAHRCVVGKIVFAASCWS